MATLLAVDDEEPILNAIQRVFADEADITVVTAASAAEAVKLLSKTDVDVILSDERMPMVAGSEFLRFAKEKYPDIPRIILTGYADQQATIRAINSAEVFRYLSKPWLPDELIAIVRKAIEYRKNRINDSSLAFKVLSQKNELESKMAELSKTIEKRTEQLGKSIELLKKQNETIANTRIDLINLLLVTISNYDLQSVFVARQISGLYRFITEESGKYSEETFHAAMLAGLLSDTKRVILPVLKGLEHFAGIAKTLVMMNENYNATGPSGYGGESIPFDARLIRVMHDLFKFNAKFPGTGRNYIGKNLHILYDPEIATLVLDAHLRRDKLGLHRFVGVADLVPGMVVAKSMKMADGKDVTEGTVLDKDLIESIEQVQENTNIEMRIPVLV